MEFPKTYIQTRTNFRENENERRMHSWLSDFFTNTYHTNEGGYDYWLFNRSDILRNSGLSYPTQYQFNGSMAIISNSNSVDPKLYCFRSLGTEDEPTTVSTDNTIIGGMSGYAYNGSNYYRGTEINFFYRGGGAGIAFVTNNVGSVQNSGAIMPSGSWAAGRADISTASTDGFLFIPNCSGVPTGVPENIDGRIGCVFGTDERGTQLYFYSVSEQEWVSPLADILPVVEEEVGGQDKSTLVSYDKKGRITNIYSVPIAIDASQVVSGVFSNSLINWASPGTIGSTTPNTGAFTTLSASGSFDADVVDSFPVIRASGSYGGGFVMLDGAARSGLYTQTAGTEIKFFAGMSAGEKANQNIVATFTSTGINSTVIGATTPAAGTFTSVTSTGGAIPSEATTQTKSFVASGYPFFAWVQSTSAANNRIFDSYVDAGALNFRSVKDGYAGAANWLTVSHGSGATPSMNFGGNVGIGVSPAVSFHVKASEALVRMENSTAVTGKTWQIGSSSDGYSRWSQVGVVDAIIVAPTTGNVGIGGTPTKRLTVFDTTNDMQAEVGYSSTFSWQFGRKASDGSFRFNGLNGGSTTSDVLVMTLGGNVGIGVTPFANSLGVGLNIKDGPGLWGYGNTTYLDNNLYYDSAWKYKATGAASLLYQNGAGDFTFFTAPSGTAGTAATITPRVYILEGGNVGIGMSPIGYGPFNVAGGSDGGISCWSTSTTTGAVIRVLAHDALSLPSYSNLLMKHYGKTTAGTVYTNASISAANAVSIEAINTSGFSIGTNNTIPIAFSPGGVEIARFTTTGLGIGVTPSYRLDVVGGAGNGVPAAIFRPDNNAGINFVIQRSGDASGTASIGTSSNHNLRLLTNNSERVFIDTAGNVGIGTTPTSVPSTGNPVVGAYNLILYNAGALGLTMLTDNGATRTQQLGFGSQGISLFDAGLKWDNSNRKIEFWTGSAAKAYLDVNGKFGISSSSPQALLSVSGHGDSGLTNGATSLIAGTTSNLSSVVNSVVYPIEFRQGLGSNTGRLLVMGYRRVVGTAWENAGWRLQAAVDNSFTGYNDGKSYLELNNSDAVYIGTNGADRVTINATGLGIGRSPSYSLDVAGSTYIGGVASTDSITYFAAGSGTKGKSSELWMSATFGASWGGADTTARWNNRIRSTNTGTDAWGTMCLDIDANRTDSPSWINLVRIMNNTGYVGIGTTPSELFHVNGNVKTNYLVFATNQINEYATNANAEIAFNYSGYNGGSTQFRDTAFYDGKGGVIALFDGSAGLLDLITGKIKFPASQLASSDVNTLDDYEEGDWTPSLGGTTTYTSRVGRYVKIGKKVTIWGVIVVNVLGTGSTTTVSGLPFTAANSAINQPGTCGDFGSLGINVIHIVPVVQNNTSTLTFTYSSASGSGSTANGAIFANGATMVFSVTYEAST